MRQRDDRPNRTFTEEYESCKKTLKNEKYASSADGTVKDLRRLLGADGPEGGSANVRASTPIE